MFPYYSEAKTIDLFGLNTKEFSKRPAGGLFLKNNEFDLIIINTSQFGTLCVDLISALSQSKQLEPIEYQNRKVNWDKFTFQLISGINKDKYNTYIYPFYSRDIKSNNNTFIFINNKSTNFKELNNFILKKAKIVSEFIFLPQINFHHEFALFYYKFLTRIFYD